MQSRLHPFFSTHPVFTVAEVDSFLASTGNFNPETRKKMLLQHSKQGTIRNLRRGLYAVVPPGQSPQDCAPDPFLVASRLAEDSVLSHHTALEFHGYARSARNVVTFLTTGKPSPPWRLSQNTYRTVAQPRALRSVDATEFGVQVRDRQGMDVQVTGPERTLVDVLDRPHLSGGWEEIWTSLESVPFFDLDLVVEHVGLLANGTAAAKVGHFLEQHRESLMVEETHLEALQRLSPKKPQYADRNRGAGVLVQRWNLVMPMSVVERRWEELA